MRGSNCIVNAGSFRACLLKTLGGSWVNGSQTLADAGHRVSQYSSCLFISARSSHSPLQTLPLESQGISARLPASFCFSPYSSVHSILGWEKPHPFHIILCRQIQHLLECRSHRTSEGFFPGAKGPEEQGIWQSVTISFQTLAAYLSS